MPFAGGDRRLFTDDAGPAHFLHLAVAVGDEPMPGKQLCRHLALVLYGYPVGKGIAVLFRLGVFLEVMRNDADVDPVALIVGHKKTRR
jgi:hypothetical protein